MQGGKPFVYEASVQERKHGNERMRGDKIPTIRGEHVKIPLLPNKVGKRSGTRATTNAL